MDRRSPPRHALNLLPMMNLVSLLIPLLLMGTQLVALSTIRVTQPLIGPGVTGDELERQSVVAAVIVGLTGRRLFEADPHLFLEHRIIVSVLVPPATVVVGALLILSSGVSLEAELIVPLVLVPVVLVGATAMAWRSRVAPRLALAMSDLERDFATSAAGLPASAV